MWIVVAICVEIDFLWPGITRCISSSIKERLRQWQRQSGDCIRRSRMRMGFSTWRTRHRRPSAAAAAAVISRFNQLSVLCLVLRCRVSISLSAWCLVIIRLSVDVIQCCKCTEMQLSKIPNDWWTLHAHCTRWTCRAFICYISLNDVVNVVFYAYCLNCVYMCVCAQNSCICCNHVHTAELGGYISRCCLIICNYVSTNQARCSITTPWVKKGATLTMAITLSILGGFAKFFYCCKQQ